MFYSTPLVIRLVLLLCRPSLGPLPVRLGVVVAAEEVIVVLRHRDSCRRGLCRAWRFKRIAAKRVIRIKMIMLKGIIAGIFSVNPCPLPLLVLRCLGYPLASSVGLLQLLQDPLPTLL